MKKMTLYDLDLKNKRVLMRVDFNVPIDDAGQITDATRIEQSLPSIQYILNQGARLILMSHLGRPKGKNNPKYSLKPCATLLSKLLNQDVPLAPDCIGDATQMHVDAMKPGSVLLLENLRFHAAEEKPEEDPNFATSLANLGECYVNDAFGTSHRKHSSTYVVPSLFPKKAAAGFLLEKEISFLSPLVMNPKRPFAAILGGAKISTKLGAIKSLLGKIDALYLGGGMVFTFLKAKKIPIGNSLCDHDLEEEAAHILKACEEKAINVHLPKDILIANNISEDAETRLVNIKDGIPDGWTGVDIGPETIEDYFKSLESAATIFWNGPMGIFEIPIFANGTNTLALQLGKLSATTIAGGGESVAAINKLGVGKNYSHISTGGGASLEFIEFGHLPGIDALSNR